MNYITINFDNSADVNAAYSQLKKLYPKNEIIKSARKNVKSEARARQELQEAMDIEFKKLGINSEEEFMDWINDVIKETRRERRSENII